MAGATQERKLLGVGSSAMLGLVRLGSPTRRPAGSGDPG